MMGSFLKPVLADRLVILGFTAAGSRSVISNHLRVFPGNDGGMSVFFRDITERKSIEQERTELLRRLSQSNEELQRFAHAVAHDLQEPLRISRATRN